jgi:F-type H+-transporting ATPase subunit epsilon
VQPADGGEELYFYVSGGMLEIQPNRVIVLADTAMRAKDLDEAAAEEARKRAEDMLKDRDSAMEVATAQAELSAAMAQLQLMEKLKKARQRR